MYEKKGLKSKGKRAFTPVSTVLIARLASVFAPDASPAGRKFLDAYDLIKGEKCFFLKKNKREKIVFFQQIKLKNAFENKHKMFIFNILYLIYQK